MRGKGWPCLSNYYSTSTTWAIYLHLIPGLSCVSGCSNYDNNSDDGGNNNNNNNNNNASYHYRKQFCIIVERAQIYT